MHILKLETLLTLFCIRELRYVAQLLRIVLPACWNVAVIMLIVSLISSKGGHVNERSYLRFIIQRPGDLIYVPSLRPHAVLALDTGQPTILSGWDASTIADSTIITRTLDEYNVGVPRGTWTKILRTQAREALRNWVHAPAVGRRASKEQLRKHWTYWETYCPVLIYLLIYLFNSFI